MSRCRVICHVATSSRTQLLCALWGGGIEFRSFNACVTPRPNEARMVDEVTRCLHPQVVFELTCTSTSRCVRLFFSLAFGWRGQYSGGSGSSSVRRKA